MAVETKTGGGRITPQLRKFHHIYGGNFPIIQVINDPGVILKKGKNEYLLGYDRFLMLF